MQLIYYAHSYRKVDDDVNEFFQELMVDESLILSLDPPSDRLNAAKPERHLRSTDAQIVVLPQRDPAPSEYIRWEIGLGLRARRPQLVFVEDVLADDLVPPGILQCRFSRRRLLREVRLHRNSIRMLKSYIGGDPPPSYQPLSQQRRCAVIGESQFEREPFEALIQCLERRNYKPEVVSRGARLLDGADTEQSVQRAALCVVAVEGLTPVEYYLLGVARAALTPTIAITHDPDYVFDGTTPREYQPRMIARNNADELVRIIDAEISTFEEDYLDLEEEAQVRRYKEYSASILRSSRREGEYSRGEREQIVNIIQNAEIDMSRDKIQVANVVGSVNIKSRFDHVTQTVQQAPALGDDRRAELGNIMEELKSALLVVAEKRPDDADRVAKSAELVVGEACKAKPDKGFLSITAAGLKQAAQTVADIAPTVLSVATKVVAFVTSIH